MRLFLIALIVLVLGFAVWVRVAPSDPARWHRMNSPRGLGELAGAGSFETRRVVEGDGAAALAALDGIARATPRTRVLAGSVEEGFVTYVTRSALWGFPDYTGVYLTQNDPAAEGATTLTIWGRLRFGQSDMGVNRARIEGWLGQMPEGLLRD